MRAIIVPIIFLIMALVYMIFPHVAVWMPVLIPTAIGLLSRMYKKKIKLVVKE